MEGNERNVFTVLAGNFGYTLESMGGAKEGKLDKVFNLLGFASLQEGREHVGPSFDVGKSTEDSLDSFQSSVVVCREKKRLTASELQV